MNATTIVTGPESILRRLAELERQVEMLQREVEHLDRDVDTLWHAVGADRLAEGVGR